MIIHSVDEMKAAARHVYDCLDKGGQEAKGASILLLSGELGAGKTAFVQNLARELGVRNRITSPTFVIQKEYETNNASFRRLVHIDAYRLASFADLEILKWSNFARDPQTIVAIEWPEKVDPLPPGNYTNLQFAHVKKGVRKILFDGKEDLCK